MRIAIVYLGCRGAGGPISLEITRYLSVRTETFAVVSTYTESLRAWRDSGLRCLQVRTFRNALGALASCMNQPQLWHVARQIRAQATDVMLFPMSHPWTPFLQWHLRDIPSVVVLHDPEPHPGLGNTLAGLWDDLAIRQARRCIILSATLQDAARRRGAAPDRIDVVPLGDLSYYQHQAGAELFVAQERLRRPDTLLFFGRITQYKGLRLLVDAFRQLVRRQPGIHLRIVGSGDMRPYAPELRDLPNVEVINRWIPESEVARYFEGASVLIVPYTSASQSGVVAIAAGLGLPVIATRVGGISEQISDEHSGLLVDPGSVDQLAAAIERLLGDPHLAQQLGENLKREFQEKRSWRSIAAMVYGSCEKAFRQ